MDLWQDVHELAEQDARVRAWVDGPGGDEARRYLAELKAREVALRELWAEYEAGVMALPDHPLRYQGWLEGFRVALDLVERAEAAVYDEGWLDGLRHGALLERGDTSDRGWLS